MTERAVTDPITAYLDRVRREAEAARHRIRPCALSAIEAQAIQSERAVWERALRGLYEELQTVRALLTGARHAEEQAIAQAQRHFDAEQMWKAEADRLQALRGAEGADDAQV